MTQRILIMLFLTGCSSVVTDDAAPGGGSEKPATSTEEAPSARGKTKKAILFTSQKGTSLSVYFATHDEFQSLAPWEPPEGPNVDVKALAAAASEIAHREIDDAENWKLSECSFNNADIGEGTSNFQYVSFHFICKSAKVGWTHTTVYMNLSGTVIKPETHDFPDYDSLNAFEEKLNDRYSDWSE